MQVFTQNLRVEVGKLSAKSSWSAQALASRKGLPSQKLSSLCPLSGSGCPLHNVKSRHRYFTNPFSFTKWVNILQKPAQDGTNTDKNTWDTYETSICVWVIYGLLRSMCQHTVALERHPIPFAVTDMCLSASTVASPASLWLNPRHSQVSVTDFCAKSHKDGIQAVPRKKVIFFVCLCVCFEAKSGHVKSRNCSSGYFLLVPFFHVACHPLRKSETDPDTTPPPKEIKTGWWCSSIWLIRNDKSLAQSNWPVYLRQWVAECPH